MAFILNFLKINSKKFSRSLNFEKNISFKKKNSYRSLVKISPNKLHMETSFNRKKILERCVNIFLVGVFVPFPVLTWSEETLLKTPNSFVTKSGMKFLDFSPGEGGKPGWGDLVVINYTMYLFSSGGMEKIDSTYERKQTFLFRHGGGQVIRGLEEAIHDMKIGGKRRVILPENLGYSIPGLGPIPPSPNGRKKLFSEEKNESEKLVIFDIEIVSIKSPQESFSWYKTDLLSPRKIRKAFDK
mmetsp:Transcript_47788/g.97703  ORF Transcript_47788/g.97703 Transcript_47788/m.97703 type:complete len:242 (+) Transcript_47788:418-1143(+)